ncbi:family 43 glycosylhydrolase [Hymenobacter taeanensis]|uniref:Family 43 glycosylhydrolase n=1 Tax=Hymenobacter taeanensis TaxID=2735321 RepID=A0A6M6BJB2_9BACT|nr:MULTISPECIES: family 43 glycosylhydrolase [Hymenobacter]QJX48207.1 family 43 glycosylhydrolase [Hymenobacter taeanensis]UOQ82316.1 family 43 glycosylhydrolase [Hymenobacter sp. 5414T-23]
MNTTCTTSSLEPQKASWPAAIKLHRSIKLLALLLGLSLGLNTGAYALQGNDNCHDPSSIIKDGNKYWVFTTGTDIYAMYSYDLVKWESGPKTVFNGIRPAWIAAKAPNFKGDYWAPECIYRNGKYYLYYSLTDAFGSNVSAIGLATNVTLDPANPSYQWVDQGEVISSTTSSAFNAIDPAIVTDASGGLWMTFGSFFKGIGLIKLDGVTGKRSGTSFSWIAGNVAADGVTRNNSGSEAPYLVRNGNYYYLFINKGACCQGSSSTYYIQVGRSTSITGPYLDKNGVDLNRNGGTTLIATSGNYVGPGHVGLFQEGGANYLTHHYYDSNQNGRARLSVSNMGWDAASWPFITRDWVASGRYTLTNQNSGLVWDAWGCTGTSGQAIAQGSPAGLNCQQWNLTPVGNGEYKITSAVGAGLAADVYGNSSSNGAVLQLYPYSGGANQRFKIERASGGTYVLSSVNGNRVVEVPACSATAGVQLALYDYLGNNCQKWGIAPATAAKVLAAQPAKAAQFSLYPNPSTRGHFTIMLGPEMLGTVVQVELTDAKGQRVYSLTSSGKEALPIAAGVPAGLYLLQVSGAGRTYTQKVVVQ